MKFRVVFLASFYFFQDGAPRTGVEAEDSGVHGQTGNGAAGSGGGGLCFREAPVDRRGFESLRCVTNRLSRYSRFS